MADSRKPYGTLTLLDFQKRFPNEQACWDYLVRVRWPKGLRCPGCRSSRMGFHKTRRLFECRVCKKQVSATAGSIFHKTRVPLRSWFWTIFFTATSKKGVPALYLQKHLGLNYRTAWLMAHKIRHAMIQRDELYQLKGKVQVDEIAVGGLVTNTTIRVLGGNVMPFKHKTPFLMAVEETPQGKPRFLRIEELDDITQEQILSIIEKRIKKRSLLKTDGATAYGKARKKGYHLVQSSYSDDPTATQNHLHWVNMAASNLKRYLLSTYHGVAPKYRKAYAAEFAYRFNRRYWPEEAFDRLLFACSKSGAKTMEELTA
jgi:transposase-like protein